ncbi:unnamed protein product, partial [Coregonus sp. 'balchen']
LSSEQVLTPYTNVEVASERDRVTLSCNYTSDVSLQWYRQYPKSAPQLVVMEYVDNTPGLILNHDKKDKRVDLEISSAEVTDSALYYCALRPTVTGNPETLFEDDKPTRSKMGGVEGDPTTLSCSYTGSINNLQLYHQYPRAKPEFLILITKSGHVQKLVPPRLSAQVRTDRVDLEIVSTEVTDSALYYCDMDPTVTGNTSSYKKLTLLVMEYVDNTPGFTLNHHKKAKRVDLEISSTEVTDCSVVLRFAAHSDRKHFIIQKADRNHFWDSINPVTTKELVQEGRNVHLYCKHDGTVYNLQWYRQYPRSKPEFILYITPEGSIFKATPPHPHLTVSIDKVDKQGRNSDEFKKRFDSRLNFTSSSVPLTIQRLQLSDSAVYYCALKPAVTTGWTAPLQKQFDTTHLTEDMESWLKNILILAAFCCECRGNSVSQPKGVETATEGGQITLTCHYKTDDPGPYLFWYKQRANDHPKYMLMRQKFGTGDNATEFNERFHADLDANSKSVPLTIQRLQLSDSAVYYCALRPTVTTGCDSCGDGIYSNSLEKDVIHGGSVKLSCNYTVSVNVDKVAERVDLEISSAKVADSALYYYALRPTVTGNPETLQIPSCNKVLLFLMDSCGIITNTDSTKWTHTHEQEENVWIWRSPLLKDRYSEVSNSDEFKKRFDSRLNFTSSSVPLTIQRLQLSDSAVYYCALRSTVTTGWTAPLQKLFDTTHLTVDMEAWLKNILILTAFCCECRGDSVSQPKEDETTTEGGQITLTCHYKTDDASPYLFWYKQRANDYPKYMLMRHKFGTGDNATEFKERFHADLDANSKSVPLTIQRLQLSDSAVYYCALRPTPRVICTEGESVTLSCSYDTSSDNILLYWYQPYPKLAPQFGDSSGDGTFSNSLEEDVIHGGSVKLSCNYTVSGGGTSAETIVTADPPNPRLSVNFDKVAERVDLEISSAKVADSALYYCALRPTVTGNPETLQIHSCNKVLLVNTISQSSMVLSITQISTPIPPLHYNLLKTLSTSIEDIVTPDRDVVDVMEGSSVKLSCRYNS